MHIYELGASVEMTVRKAMFDLHLRQFWQDTREVARAGVNLKTFRKRRK